MKRKVVIITDCTDVAYLEIRGAIYSHSDIDDFEIEPIVNVDDFNIINVSFFGKIDCGNISRKYDNQCSCSSIKTKR